MVSIGGGDDPHCVIASTKGVVDEGEDEVTQICWFNLGGELIVIP